MAETLDVKQSGNALHCIDVMEQLNQLRCREEFCDMTVIVDGRKFSAHRCVLAANSLYFESMFRSELQEVQRGSVELQCSSSDGMDAILGFMYTGGVTLTHDNVTDIIQGADHLLMEKLKEICCKWLVKHLTIENCFDMKRLADMYNLSKVKETAEETIKNGLNEMLKDPQRYLIDLSKDEVFWLVSSTNVKVREVELLGFIITWSKRERERKKKFRQLLRYIRLVDIELEYLHRLVAEEDLFRDVKCKRLVKEAIKYRDGIDAETGSRGTSSFQVLKPRTGRLVDVVVVVWRGLHGGTHYHCFVMEGEEWTLLENVVRVEYSIYQYGIPSVMNNKLVLLSNKKSFWYDPITDKSKEVAHHHALESHAVAVVDERLYVCGNVPSKYKRSENHTKMYDPKNNSWMRKSDAPHSVYSTAVAIGDRYIYAIQNQDSDDIDCYDTQADTWESISSEEFIQMKDDPSSQIWPPLIVKKGDVVEMTKFGRYKVTISNETREIVCEESTLPKLPADETWKVGPAVCDVRGDIFVCGSTQANGVRVFKYSNGTWKNISCNSYCPTMERIGCVHLEVPYKYLRRRVECQDVFIEWEEEEENTLVRECNDGKRVRTRQIRIDGHVARMRTQIDECVARVRTQIDECVARMRTQIDEHVAMVRTQMSVLLG
ncbi:kelch-like protein 11 [Glandiceps talaboti]